MAKKIYPTFTKAMRDTHTILIPSMLPIHFKLFSNTLTSLGYKNEILDNHTSDVVTEGLKYVHNDTCYPATLVIGQFIDALNKRKDTDKVVLLITQTGGGCRASNYIHLLRKALEKSNYSHIPVVALNTGSIEGDSGFDMNLTAIRKLVAAITYGDFLMYLFNKVRSYETNKDSSKELVDKWINELSTQIDNNKGFKYNQISKNLKIIAKDFDNLPLTLTPKPKVGIVGEIYVKYASLGNNDLEQFLVDEGAEVLVPGLMGFLLYSLYNNIFDVEIYGFKKSKTKSKFLIWFFERFEKIMRKALKSTKFTPIPLFRNTKDLSKGIIGHGVKMGEGWLLTAEVVELIHLGYPNVVVTQPFGCLPNHIIGRGTMKTVKKLHPEANITAIDYDPGATKVNQENRIKLMLSIAKETMKEDVEL